MPLLMLSNAFSKSISKRTPYLLVVEHTYIQLFRNRLSWSNVDTVTARNFGYTRNEYDAPAKFVTVWPCHYDEPALFINMLSQC